MKFYIIVVNIYINHRKEYVYRETKPGTNNNYSIFSHQQGNKLHLRLYAFTSY
jgi:hypothetical protein